MSPPLEFGDLVAVVTGGGAGIGLATATELSARGASVTVLDLDVSGVPERIEGIVADLRDTDAVDRALRTVGDRPSGIDILVNNAGASFVGGVEDGDLDEWHRLLDLNLLGYVRATRAALPYLRRSGRAAIVNVGSCTADTGLPARVLYSASKGAIHSMSRAMATDLVSEGIRVTCVSPGTVDTPFMDELARRAPDPGAKRAEFEARQPIGRMVSPEEVAHAIAYLASPRSAATVGTTLTVDGGLEKLRIPTGPAGATEG